MAGRLPEYTDRNLTRVASPVRGAHASARLDESIGNTQPLNKRQGLFDGLSMSQIVAGAAAAATSMLLVSRLGYVGSAIGAAVSSVVTVVATQLYRKALTAGTSKLKRERIDLRKAAGGHGIAGSDAQGQNPYLMAEEAAGAEGRDAAAAGGGMGTAGAYRRAERPTRTRTAPSTLRARAAEQRADVQRKVVLASVALAVATVIVSAVAVLALTAGEGLGERPVAVLPVLGEADAATSQSDVPADAGGNGQQGADASEQDSSAGETSGANGGGTTGSSSSGTGGNASGNDAASSSSSGNGGSSNSSSSGADASGNASSGSSDTSSDGSGNGSSGSSGDGSTGSGSGSSTGSGSESSGSTGSGGASSGSAGTGTAKGSGTTGASS